MEIQENIINKVAQSGLITFDLATLAPQGDLVEYDIKDNLFHGLILKEKDFRAFIKDHDWAQYTDKHVAIMCSSDAIIPTWAIMLLANKLEPFAKTVIFGNKEDLIDQLFHEKLADLDMSTFTDGRVVVKGCGDVHIPESAFVTLTVKLSKVAKSIMYGEPCSTVPVFKRKT